MKGPKFFILFTAIFSYANAKSSTDTLTVTFRQADSLFVVNNYYLLASAMNIEAAKALTIQARLFPNPVLSADFNAYDPENEQWFHAGSTGQKAFQIDQLILLGGKRKKEVEMAKTNTAIAELEFQSLTRQLKFKLHSNLVEIGQQQALLKKYNAQLSLLDTITTAYENQVNKGNIPLKDLVRLKGVYLNLNNDRAELLHQYYEAQGAIQVLLQTSRPIAFHFNDDDINRYIKVMDLEDLKQEALANHPDILLSKQNRILSEQYFLFQKKLAIPDVNLFTAYDQRGGAFNNQINLGLSIPLPLWNRNQGNVKSAEYHVREQEFRQQALQQEVLSDLQNNYALYTQTVAEYRKGTSMYNEDFEITVKGMSDNFKKRNVSLIEFVDFFESYNQVLAELARMKTQLVNSAELLNLSIGKDIY